jgi:putative peptide zinc metalloprotease protein
MSPAARRLAAQVVLLLLACVVPPVAQADPLQRHQDNVATADIEQDGGRAFDLEFEVLTQSGRNDVDNLNAANASARCTGCRATAIAFQIVLVSGMPERLTPHNRAVAINDQCTQCVVAAEARQFVRVVDEPVKFSDAGRQALADVREQLRALEAQDLSLADLHIAVEAQEARVLEVMRNEVVPKADAADEPEVLERRLLQDTDLG